MRGGLGPAPTTTHNAVMRLLAGGADDDADADGAAPAPPRDPLAQFLQPSAPAAADLPALRARAAAFLQFAAEADAAAPPVPCSADVDVVGHLKQTADGASRNVPVPLPAPRAPAPAAAAGASTAFPRPPPGLFSNSGFGSSAFGGSAGGAAHSKSGGGDSLAAAMAAFEAKKAAMQRATAPASLSAVSAPAPVPTTTTAPAKKGNKKPSGPLVQEIGSSAPSHASGAEDDAATDTTNDHSNDVTVPGSSNALAGLMNLNRNRDNGLNAAKDILDSLRTIGGAADDDEMAGGVVDDGKERCVEMNVVLGVLQNGGEAAPDAGFSRPPAADANGDGAALGDEQHTLCTAPAAAAASGALTGFSRRPLIAVLNERGDASSANGPVAAAAGHMAPAGVDGNAGANVVLLPGSAAEDALAEKKRRDAMALLRLTAALLDHGDSDEDSDSDTSSTSGGGVSGQEGTQGHNKPVVVQVLRSEDAISAGDDAHACG